MLNVPLLRKVQASIADESIPFNMGNWNDCICGHCHRVLTGEMMMPPDTFPADLCSLSSGVVATLIKKVSEAIGIDDQQAWWLFRAPYANREGAILGIDALIEREQEAETVQHEEELVCA